MKCTFISDISILYGMIRLLHPISWTLLLFYIRWIWIGEIHNSLYDGNSELSHNDDTKSNCLIRWKPVLMQMAYDYKHNGNWKILLPTLLCTGRDHIHWMLEQDSSSPSIVDYECMWNGRYDCVYHWIWVGQWIL